MERRNSRRYRISAPAFCWWQHSDGELQVTRGTTVDISHRGTFIVSKSLPSPGAHVELYVYLPSVGLPPRFARLHGEGTVLRVSRAGAGQSGFAADVTFQTESSDASIISGPKRIQ